MMCPYSEVCSRSVSPAEREQTGHPVWTPEEWRAMGFHKKKKLKCPECGRKVNSMIHIDFMDKPTRIIPPHKVKKWWKKK